MTEGLHWIHIIKVEMERRERDVESDFRILCGDIDDRLKLVVLRDEQYIVAFFLSSTFTDTEWERNLLISDVLPYLAELARKYGLELRLAEMRWGIREEASSEHQTSEICMNVLEQCPSFLLPGAHWVSEATYHTLQKE